MKEFILFAVVCLLFWSVKGASWRDHVAGGVAGGLSTVLIYPIDTIKTVIQTKKDIHSVKDALRFVKKGGICNMYSGLTPALIGSIPSSALYFGTYELVKSKLSKVCSSRRHLTNIVASASGNVMSSVVFVPKETLKQQLQAFRTGVLKLPASYPMTTGGVATYIYETEGLPGFFSSFQATMLRNVPSTAVRLLLSATGSEILHNIISRSGLPYTRS